MGEQPLLGDHDVAVLDPSRRRTRSRDNPTKEGVQNAVNDAKEATKTFTDDVKGLGDARDRRRPAGQDALNELSSDVEAASTRSSRRSRPPRAPAPRGALSAISAVSATLSTLMSQVTTTFSQLQNLNGGEELKDAFDDADSCDELRLVGMIVG